MGALQVMTFSRLTSDEILAETQVADCDDKGLGQLVRDSANNANGLSLRRWQPF